MATALTNIPRIMRAHRWYEGAALLDSWYSRPSTAYPHYDTPDVGATISMDWVLGYERAREVYSGILEDRIWSTPPARIEVAKMLRQAGRLNGPRSWFGNLALSADKLDPVYINYRTVKFGLNQLDGLTAALGNFAFRVAVAGEVEGLPSGETRVDIWQVGVYVRDSFDFEGDQFLGYWDDTDNAVSMINPLSGDGVSNEDFRDWRTTNNRGGDFIVYSNVRFVALGGADSFTVR